MLMLVPRPDRPRRVRSKLRAVKLRTFFLGDSRVNSNGVEIWEDFKVVADLTNGFPARSTETRKCCGAHQALSAE